MALENVILLVNVRLSFPHLTEPQVAKGDDGNEKRNYSAELIMAPEHPGWAKFHEVVNKMAYDKWTEKWQHAQQMIQGDRKKRCFGWGQEKVNQKTFQIYDGYPGNVFITAGNKRMPQMIDAQGQGVDPMNAPACLALAREMYGGCRVNVAVKPWLQENKHGLGIRCELVSVQKAGDDEPFGEAVRDASELFQGAAPVTQIPPGFAPPPGAPGMPPGFAPPPGIPPMPAAPFPVQPGIGNAAQAWPNPAAQGVPPFLR